MRTDAAGPGCVALPAPPPDLDFPSLGTEDAARDFAFVVKRAAMGPHIAARWGWDETFQQAIHIRRFAEKPFRAIWRRGEAIGTLSLLRAEEHLHWNPVGALYRRHGFVEIGRSETHCFLERPIPA